MQRTIFFSSGLAIVEMTLRVLDGCISEQSDLILQMDTENTVCGWTWRAVQFSVFHGMVNGRANGKTEPFSDPSVPPKTDAVHCRISGERRGKRPVFSVLPFSMKRPAWNGQGGRVSVKSNCMLSCSTNVLTQTIVQPILFNALKCSNAFSASSKYPVVADVAFDADASRPHARDRAATVRNQRPFAGRLQADVASLHPLQWSALQQFDRHSHPRLTYKTGRRYAIIRVIGP